MDILQHIGYSEEEKNLYRQLENKLGEQVYPLADAYFSGVYQHISEIYEPLCAMTQSQPDLLGAMLLTVVRCAEQRAQILSGEQQELFLQSLPDIAAKTRECLAYKNAFGIFVLNWYDGLLKNWRPQLGRLQYEVGVHTGEPVTVGHLPCVKGTKSCNAIFPPEWAR